MIRDTQKTSYELLKPQLGMKQKQVVLALMQLTKATNRELATHLGWEINSVTGRVNELMHKKLITSNGTRLDTYTKRNVTLWQLTK